MGKHFLLIGLLLTALAAAAAIARPGVQASGLAQIPTLSVATVTSTPRNAWVKVLANAEQDQINVRACPSATSSCEIVGLLIVNQEAPALGRTPGGDWIQIAYPGAPNGLAWVYSPLVELSGSPPIVELPPTSTPRVTPTIDPTLAAQFLVEVPPTRLPTFTPPPPINLPTFPPETTTSAHDRVPMGMLIVGMAMVGLFGTLISFLRGR